MTSLEMITKLQREDLKGVGVRATYIDGSIHYYFYEDFEEDKGVNRASRHFHSNEKIKCMEYFYEVYHDKDLKHLKHLKKDYNFLAIGNDGKEYKASYSSRTKTTIISNLPMEKRVKIIGYLKVVK